MGEKLLAPDKKGEASIILGELLKSTASNFPEPQFRVRIEKGKSIINPHPFEIYTNADGGGTKPEIAERLFDVSKDPEEFESVVADVCAMIDGDSARDGSFLLGITDILDVTTANKDIVKAVAKGLGDQARIGQFAILNGETAELGYRAPGYGGFGINLNAVGFNLYVPEKEITGERLAPGQIVVAFREDSIRSNGLSAARWLLQYYYAVSIEGQRERQNAIKDLVEKAGMITELVRPMMHKLLGDDFAHGECLPWHEKYPEIAKQLKLPSRLYGPIMYEAQGGVFGERKVDIVAAAHITGGGIPLKGIRMVKGRNLGLAIDHVFPDPEAITSIIELAWSIHPDKDIFIDNITACEEWNRGIGFMVVVPDEEEAKKLIDIAGQHKCEAAIAGEVIDEPAVKFHGHTWRYEH